MMLLKFRPLGLLILALTLLVGCQSSAQRSQGSSMEREPHPPIAASPLPSSLVPQKLAIAPGAGEPWIKDEFLAGLESQGANLSTQGLWLQSDERAMAAYQESLPLSAASVTKVATTLAALQKLGPEFRFQTRIGRKGQVSNGILQGDLVVSGGDDPFFVWEDGFSIAQVLGQLGIQKITGDVVIQAPFVMNFESDTQEAGHLLKQALDARLWPPEAVTQFNTLPAATPKPQILIQGNVRLISQPPPETVWIVQHSSLPLVELLKRMNRYSNNPMADQIANHLGGAQEVTRIVRSLTGLNEKEISFINGSGLGEENRITPQGATLIFKALSNMLQSNGLSLGDVLTIVGKDEGILETRSLPAGLVVKSGTLNHVSALAGVLPTQSKGLVWFAIQNNNGNVEAFRQQQEQLLQKLSKTWGLQGNHPLLTPKLQSEQLKPITQAI